MSGHSKWATIHRQKETKDQARGKLFSKLAREISLAIKGGGGPNPEANFKLRVAIDKAKAFNLPKENIDRVLRQAQDKLDLEEVSYEGFGPNGVAVIVEGLTDNKNRTGQEIKNIFERVGGRLAGPGSVSFNFETKGLIVVSKEENLESQILDLIDTGAEEVEETQDGVEVYLPPEKISEIRGLIEERGFKVSSSEITQKPKNYVTPATPEEAKILLVFLETLNEHQDVQKVFANLDIPDNLLTN